MFEVISDVVEEIDKKVSSVCKEQPEINSIEQALMLFFHLQ